MNEAMHQQARVMGPDEMQRLLKKCSHGRLGLAFQNEPYVVPVSYGYDQGRIFFHSAKQGKKVDFMRRNNKVCFEVDEYQKGWASVLCYGTAATNVSPLTTANVYSPGCIYFKIVAGGTSIMYLNTGTAASPTWTDQK